MPCECMLSGTNDYLFAAVAHAALNCVCHFTAPLPLNCSRRRRAMWFKHRYSYCLTCEGCPLDRAVVGGEPSSRLFFVNLLGEPSSRGCTGGEPSSRFLTEPFSLRAGRLGRCPLSWRPQLRNWLPTGRLRKLSAKQAWSPTSSATPVWGLAEPYSHLQGHRRGARSQWI